MLVSFQAKGGPDRVQLNWRLASEKNLASYTVQRSADRQTYSDRAVMPPKGTPASTTDYAATDVELPQSGTLYYRLKMTDHDGTLAYSKTEAVTIDPRALYLSVSPNSVHGTIRAELVSPDNDLPVSFTLANTSGQAIRQVSRTLRKGANPITIDAQPLPAGSYTLKASDGIRQVVARVLVE